MSAIGIVKARHADLLTVRASADRLNCRTPDRLGDRVHNFARGRGFFEWPTYPCAGKPCRESPENKESAYLKRAATEVRLFDHLVGSGK